MTHERMAREQGERMNQFATTLMTVTLTTVALLLTTVALLLGAPSTAHADGCDDCGEPSLADLA